MVAGRAKDVSDAEALVLMNPKLDRARLRRRVRELAAAMAHEAPGWRDEHLEPPGASAVLWQIALE